MSQLIEIDEDIYEKLVIKVMIQLTDIYLYHDLLETNNVPFHNYEMTWKTDICPHREYTHVDYSTIVNC